MDNAFVNISELHDENDTVTTAVNVGHAPSMPDSRLTTHARIQHQLLPDLAKRKRLVMSDKR